MKKKISFSFFFFVVFFSLAQALMLHVVSMKKKSLNIRHTYVAARHTKTVCPFYIRFLSFFFLKHCFFLLFVTTFALAPMSLNGSRSDEKTNDFFSHVIENGKVQVFYSISVRLATLTVINCDWFHLIYTKKNINSCLLTETKLHAL